MNSVHLYSVRTVSFIGNHFPGQFFFPDFSFLAIFIDYCWCKTWKSSDNNQDNYHDNDDDAENDDDGDDDDDDDGDDDDEGDRVTSESLCIMSLAQTWLSARAPHSHPPAL